MNEMKIMLRRNPDTGKLEIVVKLDSDPDALPIEHEQMHRQLVEKLLGRGAKSKDRGDPTTERESP